MTIPSKTCTRSFSPSITFTCTRTLSPGAKPPRSRLTALASTPAIASVAMFVSSARSLARSRQLAAARHLVHPLAFLACQRHGLQEVRPAREGAPERLAAPPPVDPAVVPRQKH